MRPPEPFTAAPTKTDEPSDFDELFRLWYRPIVALCRRHLGSDHDAEAVAQEAFVRAWVSWERFGGDRPFGPWISTIARRLCLNEYVAVSRRRQLARRAALGVTVPPTDEEALDEAVLGHEVRRALASLSARDRRLIVLHHVEGWSYEEIARFTQVSVESVRGVLKRARAGFRRAYDGPGSLVGVLVHFVARWRRSVVSGVEAGLSFLGRGGGLDAVLAAVALLMLPATSGAVRAEGGERVETFASAPATAEATPPADDGQAGRVPVAIPVVATPGRATGNVVGDDPFADGSFYRFTPSPNYEQDHTVFAVGMRHGDGTTSVVRSTDGGASWELFPTTNFPLGAILFPPAYPRDPRVFVTTAGKLWKSVDGGHTFEQRAFDPRHTRGSISPLFSEGDPRIFFGGSPWAQEYDDRDGVVRPMAVTLPGAAPPSEFSFSPGFADDRTVLVQAMSRIQVGVPEAGITSDLYRCDDRWSCERVLRSADLLSVKWSTRPGTVVAWTLTTLHRSVDHGRTFRTVPVPGDPERSDRQLVGIVPGADGSLVAVVRVPPRTEITDFTQRPAIDEYYLSHDGAVSWTKVSFPFVSRQGDVFVLPDGAMLVSLHPPGPAFACSTDGGHTWETGRCRR